jgi:hypothetical protein
MSEASDSTKATVKTAILWGGLLLLVVAAGVTISDETTRRLGLRTLLALLVVVEILLAFPQMFHEPRTEDAAAVGPMQDAGFYNLAMALLFALCAARPEESTVALAAAIPLYAIHAGTHLLRYAGLYYGGEAPIPGRPRHLDLRAGLQLTVALAAMVLFYPPSRG